MYYKLNDKDIALQDIQVKLKSLNYYSGQVDGHFGRNTLSAVKQFQKDNKLLIDGIIGPRFIKMLEKNTKDSFQLTENAIQQASEVLNVDVALIRAIAEVETNGDGFLAPGKPKILYERHWMYKLLKKDKMYLLIEVFYNLKPELINKSSGGYVGGHNEWSKLEEAMQIHREHALSSCSWGRFQIMGFHYKALGYNTIDNFVSRMCDTEDEHLDALVKFISNDSILLKALREFDYEGFCFRYNGPNYKKNKYDIKLKEAYSRHSLT